MVRGNRQREPAAGEADELQRQGEAPIEGDLDEPKRRINLGEVEAREGDRGVRDDELGAGVGAGDKGDVGVRVADDAAGEGEEGGEEPREGRADGGEHGGEARRRGWVEADEVDREGAEDEVEVGDDVDGREARRRG